MSFRASLGKLPFSLEFAVGFDNLFSMLRWESCLTPVLVLVFLRHPFWEYQPVVPIVNSRDNFEFAVGFDNAFSVLHWESCLSPVTVLVFLRHPLWEYQPAAPIANFRVHGVFLYLPFLA